MPEVEAADGKRLTDLSFEDYRISTSRAAIALVIESHLIFSR